MNSCVRFRLVGGRLEPGHTLAPPPRLPSPDRAQRLVLKLDLLLCPALKRRM